MDSSRAFNIAVSQVSAANELFQGEWALLEQQVPVRVNILMEARWALYDEYHRIIAELQQLLDADVRYGAYLLELRRVMYPAPWHRQLHLGAGDPAVANPDVGDA
jgi:hypothetical protein